jgi:hypothetical protein
MKKPSDDEYVTRKVLREELELMYYRITHELASVIRDVIEQSDRRFDTLQKDHKVLDARVQRAATRLSSVEAKLDGVATVLG